VGAAVDSNHLPLRYHLPERCADRAYPIGTLEHQVRCYQACLKRPLEGWNAELLAPWRQIVRAWCHAHQVTERDWTALFNETFAGPESPIQDRIWREVFRDEYPTSLGLHSYTTISELNRFVSELRLSAGDVLVDLGCGRGGPGLWVAAQTGAHLIGIDIAETALKAAQDRARALGIIERAEFHQGSFQDTGLGRASANAVMSIDALLFTPDKQAAVEELARILLPEGRLVITTWDYSRQPVGRPPQVSDHRSILQKAGFEVLGYEETPGWLKQMSRIDELLLAAVDEIAAERGSDPVRVRESIEELDASLACMKRRVFIVAIRKSTELG
jgi:SAM-dependent methyltransferase